MPDQAFESQHRMNRVGSAVVNDFPGMVDNIDPRDLPPGAAEIQLNATSVKMGELQIRLGLRDITFEGDV
jgi:hypothetical protein